VERSHRGSGLPGSSRGGSFAIWRGAFRAPAGRPWQRGLVIAAALIAFTLGLPLTSGDAQPRAPQPSFNELVAQARLLAHQIDTLSQQYDGLQVRLTETRSAAKAAAKTAARDMVALAGGVQKVSQIAAESYESGGYDPTLQLATSNDPQGFIDRASIMDHLRSENGDVVHALQTAEAAANRAQETAQQQSQQVASLVKQMAVKRNQIQSKVNLIESAAYEKALAIANQTGNFPVTAPVGDSLGARALRFALSKQGSPYVWGAAGPDAFDCSGLVMWAYAQIGIQLPHYTGYQWNSGVHISRNQLEPGDLVFFYQDISHVGLYIGNGLMIDAPDFGETVHVEQIYWSVYVGAVRIAI
jgi:peptidoglycan DL-endopeptidase CwlO